MDASAGRRGPAAVVVAVMMLAGCSQGSGGRPPAPTHPTTSAAGGAPTSAPVAGAPPSTVGSGTGERAGLPDATLTPGATDPRVTQATIGATICTRGYTVTVRPPLTVTAPLKRQQMAAYHRSGPVSAYEEDHLISLELGGAPADPLNLWPEPRDGAPEAVPGRNAADKNLVEHAAHSAVCSGAITLAEVQHAIARDWVALGVRLGVRR